MRTLPPPMHALNTIQGNSRRSQFGVARDFADGATHPTRMSFSKSAAAAETVHCVGTGALNVRRDQNCNARHRCAVKNLPLGGRNAGGADCCNEGPS